MRRFDRVFKSVLLRSEADSKVVGNAQTVAKHEQNTLIGCRLAGAAGVSTVAQPRKSSHSTCWANPINDVRILSEQAVEDTEIALCDVASTVMKFGPMADSDLGDKLFERNIHNRIFNFAVQAFVSAACWARETE